MSLRVCLALLAGLLLATDRAAAQVVDTVWKDPTPAQAIRDAQLIVRGVVSSVGPDGAVYQVEATLKGADHTGQKLRVIGLHHPRLDPGPPVAEGDRAYLLLDGKPDAQVYSVPTPTMGRFPLRKFGERELVVVPVGDTFVRLPVEPTWLESFVAGVLGGDTQPMRDEARKTLAAEDLDPTSAYQALAVLAQFGSPADLVVAERVLDDSRFQHDETWKVRMMAARVLGRAGGEEAAQRLLGLAESDAVNGVRSTAALAVGYVLQRARGSAWQSPVCARLAHLVEAELTPARLEAGSASSISLARIDDPRTNELESVMAAGLDSLGRCGSRAGVRAAMRALEAHRKANGVGLDTHEALVAGLAYLESLGDPALVEGIIQRMRTPDAEDAFLNSLFARTLTDITGEKLGESRAAWMAWWRKVAPGQGPR